MRLRTPLAFAAALTLIASSPAAAASADVVISEVYGGGGNAGATLTNDFIELHNTGAAAVDVTGWSVQYASAAGTSWSATALSGSIAAGGFYPVGAAAAEIAGRPRARAGGPRPCPAASRRAGSTWSAGVPARGGRRRCRRPTRPA